MTKRVFAWIGTTLLVLVAIGIGWVAVHGTTIRKEFTEAEVQSRLDEALTKHQDSTFKATSAKVTFTGSDTVSITASLAGTYLGRSGTADLAAEGVPVYRDGSFFFHTKAAPRLSNIVVMPTEQPAAPDTTTPSTGAFAKTKELMKAKAKEFADTRGLTEIAETFKTELAAWLMTKVDGYVVGAFERYPLYTLKNDTKGWVVRAALEKVEIVDQKLVVTLSLVQLGYSILFALLVLIVALTLAVGLIRNPEWGMALALGASLDM